MVLRYMVSDTDLRKGELRPPEMEVEQPVREVDQPKRSIPSSQKKVKLKLFFLMVIVILGMVVYYLWTADLITPILITLPINKGLVKTPFEQGWLTSIVYSEENASAMVSNKIVHEGDMVKGYKVLKIHRDKVEFEKNGTIIIKQLNK
ncbi:hypothetical protein ES703_108793 [subsurface metagenome]